MKIINSTIVRAFIALVAGVLLIKYRDDAVHTAIKIIGILFFLSGVISVAIYYVNHHHKEKGAEEYDSEGKPITQKSIAGEALPFVGLGSIILGGLLFFMPDVLKEVIQYVLVAMIILGSLGEFVILLRAGASPRRAFIFWILPCLLFLFGLAAIIYPSMLKLITETPFILIGVALIIYGLSEFINALKVRSIRRALAREEIAKTVKSDPNIQDAEVVE